MIRYHIDLRVPDGWAGGAPLVLNWLTTKLILLGAGFTWAKVEVGDEPPA